MKTFATTWPLFLTIVGSYTLLSLFILGAKKAFFEPFDESAAEPEKAGDWGQKSS